MGQLIKLQDYISRYEQSIFHYPSRYVRLKKQHWEKVLSSWENGEGVFNEEQENDVQLDWFEEEEKQPLFSKIKGLLKFGKKNIDDNEIDMGSEERLNEDEEPSHFHFHTTFSSRPNTMIELKQQFLDQLIRFQLKWASSTLFEKSYVDRGYFFDPKLKFFLQRFPDTFLIMYHPIFLLKKAPIEVETIMITPTEVWCISFLEEEDQAVYIGSKDRFWIKRTQKQEKKILNPLLGLDRTQRIVQTMFKTYEIDLPVHKVLLSRNGYIDFPSIPFGTTLVEKRNYDDWFEGLRKNHSPLKHVQLKGANVLLQYCQTSSFKRHEWVPDDENNQDDFL